MTTIHIPPAALEAGARALYRHDYPNREVWSFDAMTPEAQDKWIRKARAAFVAMVTAWPGMRHRPEVPSLHASPSWPGALILPLTENPDAER